MATSNLLKVITAPSKIAHVLDWKKAGGATILNLEIHKDRIGMALASHPSIQPTAITLDPIPISSRKKRQREDQQQQQPQQLLSESSKNRLEKIVKDNKVCGFVVSFPQQQDTGMYGASCGRVLYTLERLLMDNDGDKASSSSNNNNNNRRIISSNRPICLWNNLPMENQQIDEWGRNPLYARTYPETRTTTTTTSSSVSVYKASEERYTQDEAVVASEVWDDFVKVHWPTIYEQKQIYSTATTSTYPSSLDKDEYDEYINEEEDQSSWEEEQQEGDDDLIALCIHA